MLSLMGGLVLSAPSDALAEDKDQITTNEKKRSQIEDFINSNLVKDNSKKTMSEKQQDVQKIMNEIDDTIVPAYNAKLAAIADTYQCEKEDDSLIKNTLRAFGKRFSYANYAEIAIKRDTCKGLTDAAAQEGFNKAKEAFINLGYELDQKIAQYRYLESVSNYEGDIYQYQYCAKRGQSGNCEEYGYIDFIVNSVNNTLETLDGASRGCVPLPFKLFESRSCLFCPLFDVIFSAIQSSSTLAYNKMGKPLSLLVLIGLSIWIAIMVLQNVSSMTKQDAPKFLNDLFKSSFKIVITFLLLRYSAIIYGIIIGPLLKAGFEFGTAFLTSAQNAPSSTLSGCSKALTHIGAGSSSGVLPQYVYENLNCFIKSVQYELATSQAIGSSLMCVSTNAALGNFGPVARVMPDFMMMFQGALIYIISFILSLAFGFYLIDATVQLGIFGMILPFLLLCYPFKITKNYFDSGVKVFMNSWFIYVFMGIVVNITLQLIGQGLTGGKGGFTEIEDAINGNDVKKLQDLLDIGFSGFLVLLACCVFGVKLMQKVESLAGKFSGGLNLGIGNKIGGLAASGATGAAKESVKLGGNIASSAAGAAKSAYNARIFGDDGKEYSLGDKLRIGERMRNVKHGAARAVGKGLTATGRGIGKTLAAPSRIASAAFHALAGRRNPSA